MSSKVDDYLARSQLWPAEIAALRPVLLATGLDEELKWGKPCYGRDGHNIAIIQENMSAAAELHVPLVVEAGNGDNRAQALSLIHI